MLLGEDNAAGFLPQHFLPSWRAQREGASDLAVGCTGGCGSLDAGKAAGGTATQGSVQEDPACRGGEGAATAASDDREVCSPVEHLLLKALRHENVLVGYNSCSCSEMCSSR